MSANLERGGYTAMNIRFYNALILTMEEDRHIFEGEVWVKDERILYVGSGKDKDLVSECSKEPCLIWDEEIDCNGNLLMPGFKNAHTHSGMTLLRSYADDLPLHSWLNNQVFPIEAKMSAEDIYHMAGVGSSVVASIQLSKGKLGAARLNVTQALLFVTIAAIVPSALMMAYPSATARFLGASEHLTPMVREYLLWFIPSLIFQMWCSVCLFMIRLDGAPKLAMMCNIIAAIITVILGWLFIFPLGWGLTGAAFAATIALFASGATGLIYLWKFAHKLRLYPIKWSIRSFRFSLLNIVCQCRIGSSALLTEATLATLMFVGNHTLMKYLGDNGVGAFGIACYYLPFVFMVGNAIAQSAQPIISYNFGLGEKKRVADTKRIALFTSVVCGIVTTAAFILFPHILVGLFVNPDSTAALIAIEGFPYFSLAFVFFIINLMLIGYYQSVENVKLANLFALLRGFVFLIP